MPAEAVKDISDNLKLGGSSTDECIHKHNEFGGWGWGGGEGER